VSKHSEEIKIELSPHTLQQMEHEVRYSTKTFDDLAYMFWQAHPLRWQLKPNKHSPEERKEAQRKLRVLVEATLQKFIHKNRPIGRCPECGHKLASRQCLACDLKKGIVEETIRETASKE
jgi:hypothetical protein